MHHILSRINQKGFTVVETIIVLAIAGFILLIVFEAIPALERSSRNNQRRQDIQTILAAVSHYELNNSGNIPNTPSVGDNFLQYSKLNYYNQTDKKGIYVDVTVISTALYNPNKLSNYPGSLNITNNTSLNDVVVVNHAICSSNGSATHIGASYSDVVALYSIEAGASSSAHQCQQI